MKGRGLGTAGRAVGEDRIVKILSTLFSPGNPILRPLCFDDRPCATGRTAPWYGSHMHECPSPNNLKSKRGPHYITHYGAAYLENLSERLFTIPKKDGSNPGKRNFALKATSISKSPRQNCAHADIYDHYLSIR